ncbi:hypothetical protein N7509_007868 [Penicillium cosmopolitanum]|uniref:Fungal N-terminal domain-containing protein n=1 Tax=Penicillium cosmopolitanum TaxID=1131564 RepID=A0A9X0B8V3_9EURO|nr:uncharacterized protein N7509_007868 [Penicillium cosmopolitanum]KAJ5392378.1 hypothetical protein N7509_007868 [Penicillium cosmopolitanum]
MSDPLSVTGSAVGVISLGLSICNAIIRYAQNAQGQSDDMQYLATKASNIRSLLKNLRELIEETENDLPDVAEDLESKALGLQAYLDKLNGPIKQYERAQVAATGVRSRARRTWETAVYHFKKEELFEVRDCLQSMEMDLNTALNVFSARELHKFGAKQDIFGFKQDLLMEKMDTLQLSITTTSHQTVFQEPTPYSLPYRGDSSVQGCGSPLAYNWKNIRAKQGRKQYRFYSRWLSRAFTGTFCLSTEPGIFPIVSLHCHTVVSPESCLGMMFYEEGSFGYYFVLSLNEFEFSKKIDDWIQTIQFAISEGKIRPTDELLAVGMSPDSEFGRHLSLIDLAFPGHYAWFIPLAIPALRKFCKYMFGHNVTTNYRNPFSFFRKLCKSFTWTEEAHHLASYIIERCGPINWAPSTWIEKKNMQSLLRRDEDSLDLPSEFMAVLRESERDLRDLLESKLSSSQLEDTFGGITLLQLAMGWPAGVTLLLKAQSSIHLPRRYHDPDRGFGGRFGIEDEDNKIDEYVESCNILLKAGYIISHQDIERSSSNILRGLLIKELAKRRRKLLDIAEAHISPGELSDLRKGETGIPDTYAPALCDALIAKGLGHKIDQTLMTSERKSLFSYDLPTEILDNIYEAGFTDVEILPEERCTPLMVQCINSGFWWNSTYMATAWMISNGANPFRKFPGSNTTVLHWINGRLAWQIYLQFQLDGHFDPYVVLHHFHQIDMHLFSLSTRDACSCSCSLDGCTPLSIALRNVVDDLYLGDQHIGQVASCFRRFLEFLLDRTGSQSKHEICHAMIRSLTFDGLSLSHTCCTKLQRDESDLQEIREEQKVDLERFEKLVFEFDSQFVALGLPLMDFLQEIWYERMVKFLLERDKYDPEHHEKIRELGINFWEMDEIQIPLVVQLICDQVRVVESDSEDS